MAVKRFYPSTYGPDAGVMLRGESSDWVMFVDYDKLLAAGAALEVVVRDLAHGIMPSGARHVEVLAAWEAAVKCGSGE